jgi:tryptophan-rich sensory protein
MTSFVGTKINNEDFARIALVMITAVASSVILSGKMKTGGSYDNCILSKSSIQPPGYVFGLVWFLLYLGYIIAWLYVVRQAPPETSIRDLDILFAIGMIINLSWSVFLIGFQSKVGSDFIMFILIAYSLYSAKFISSHLYGKARYTPAVIWYFLILALWGVFAVSLSLSTTLRPDCKW